MLQTVRTRLSTRHEDERGFTLIELMVVVLIIAILLAIAIPTFLGAQNKAKDRDAQSSLRNSMAAAKTIATDKEGDYTDATSANLQTAEPNYTFVVAATASAAPQTISVSAALDTWAAAAWSKSGKCFYIKVSPGGTDYGSSTDATKCTGTDALTAAATKW